MSALASAGSRPVGSGATLAAATLYALLACPDALVNGSKRSVYFPPLISTSPAATGSGAGVGTGASFEKYRS